MPRIGLEPIIKAASMLYSTIELSKLMEISGIEPENQTCKVRILPN